jgi:flagellar basal-body rod protein FlgG
MIRALSIAGSGMKIQQMQLDTIANNLSNVNTTGFKKNNIEFQDMLYQKMQVATRQRPVNIEVGTGARLSSTMVDFSQGILEAVENPFSLAIDGMGFFKVQLGNGDIGYSRNGAFNLNADNVLVTADGYKVLNTSGAEIKLPAPLKMFK